MKYILLNEKKFKNEKEKNTQITTTYSNQFVKNKGQRKLASQRLWQAIKQHPNDTFYTLDNFLAILVDGCILKEDYPRLFSLISTHEKLRQNFVWILDSKLSEISSDKEINLAEYVYPKGTDVVAIENEVMNTRKKALNFIRDLFFQSPEFYQYWVTDAYKLLKHLEPETLKSLVFQNVGATPLLLTKLAAKVVHILDEADIRSLFMQKTTESFVTTHTLIILDFCEKYMNGSLKVILNQISAKEQETSSDQRQTSNAQIKQRLLMCGEEFLEFLKNKTGFFLPLCRQLEVFFEVLNLTSDPIKFLTTLRQRDADVAKWMIENVLPIAAGLLQRLRIPSHEIVEFIKSGQATILDNKDASFQAIFNAKIQEVLDNLDTCSTTEASDLYVLLGNKEFLQLVSLKGLELVRALSTRRGRKLFDYLTAVDNRLWEIFKKNNLKKETHAKPETMESPQINLEFIRAREKLEDLGFNFLANSKKEHILNVTALLTYIATVDETNPFESFLIANESVLWKNIVTALPADCVGTDNEKLTLFRYRIEYDKKYLKQEMSFIRYFINIFIQNSNLFFNTLEGNHLELFCTLANGKDYIALLTKFHEEINQDVTSESNQYIQQVLRCILSNAFFITKIKAVINPLNISLFFKFLDENGIADILPNNILIPALCNYKGLDKANIIQSLCSNPHLLLRLLCESRGKAAESMIHLFNKHKNILGVLEKLEYIDYVEILDNADTKVVLAILSSRDSNFEVVKQRFCETMISNISSLTNLELILYILSNKPYSDVLFSALKKEDLLSLLNLESVRNSKEVSESLLSCIRKFDVNKIFDDRSQVIALLKVNKFFASYFLQNWPLVFEVCISQEELLEIALSWPVGFISYILEQQNTYLDNILFGNITALPESLQKEMAKLQIQATTKKSVQFSNHEKKIGKVNLSEGTVHKKLPGLYQSLINLNSDDKAHFSYRNHVGLKAHQLKLLHVQLNFNFKSGLDKLIEIINNAEINLEKDSMPLSFILIKEVYETMKGLAPEIPKLHHYLATFPRAYKTELINEMEISKEEDKIVYILVVNRLKELDLLLIQQLNAKFLKMQNELLRQMFLERVLALTENYPDETLKLFKESDFVKALYIALYGPQFTGLHECKHSSELLLRFFMLTKYKKGIEAKTILTELSHQSLLLIDDRVDFLKNLFPIKKLKSKSVLQKGLFLRSASFTENLTQKELITLIDKDKELARCCLIYPHLYKKLNDENILYLLSLLNLGSNKEEGLVSLKSSKLTQSITEEHPLFSEKVQNKSLPNGQTTSRLLVKLATTHGKKTPEVDQKPRYSRMSAKLSKLPYCQNFQNQNPAIESAIISILGVNNIPYVGYDLMEKAVIITMESSLSKEALHEKIEEFLSLIPKERLKETRLDEKGFKQLRDKNIVSVEAKDFVSADSNVFVNAILKELQELAEVKEEDEAEEIEEMTIAP